MKKNFNYRIAEYFVNNQRLTVLCLGLLVLTGVVTTLLLKTTGFPQPEVKLVIVQAVYPGASAETMVEEVTKPLEGAIKEVPGIDTYASTTNNSFAIIQVYVEESADSNVVQSKIGSAIDAINLPSGVETPTVATPGISGPDLIFSIAGTNLADVYARYAEVKRDLSNLAETASIEPVVDLQQRLLVTLDPAAVAAKGLTATGIETAIRSLSETLPVANDVNIDDATRTIQTTLTGKSLEDVQQLELAATNGSVVRLDDVANIELTYQFADDTTPVVAVRDTAGKITTLPAVTLNLKIAKTADTGKTTKAIEAILAGYESTYFIAKNEVANTDKPWIIEHYTSQVFNDRQVNEVVSGLIGGKLDVDSPLANIGWLLGGIQLVMLVMIAFVSWRAALVAGAAIPLSLVFSNIFLFFTGNSLNTLVLFSLVLVIGLVVDPALVILESIQRKIDAGLKGKAATLAAIDDVGNGLFLATLTNIIVFFPFGVMSGLLGQIFSYIPLTVIPATIGSYIVPLIFLAWAGGLVLKPGKRNSNNEEKNLWPLARWVINTNERILNGSAWLRLMIIVIALVVPLAVTGYLFGNKYMKVVQFASGRNSDFLVLGVDYFSSTPATERTTLLTEAMAQAADNDAVVQVFPLQGKQYYIALKDAKERGSYLALDVNEDLNAKLEPIRSKFFDLTNTVDSVGVPAADYELSLAVKDTDSAKRKTAALAVGEAILNLCNINGTITVTDNCSGERIGIKVDDGYTGRSSSVIDIQLNREKLLQYQLTIPQAPLSLLANQIVRQQFPAATTKDTTISINDVPTYLTLANGSESPATVDDLRNLVLFNQPPFVVRLSDIAEITETESTASISRTKGETQAVVLGRLAKGYNDQAVASMAGQAVVDYFNENDGARLTELGLTADAIGVYTEGNTASNNKSFIELFVALILAIVLTYIVLSVFFSSFTQPLVVLFTIPLSFLGIFPALSFLGGGEFGFLEIIGLIILVGIVENVAIFLIDAARQRLAEGDSDVRAIAYAAGVRLRPVLLTKFTAIASLAPLAALSETYQSISLVIMFGLLTSGFTSLFTTPILYIFFRRLSTRIRKLVIRKA